MAQHSYFPFNKKKKMTIIQIFLTISLISNVIEVFRIIFIIYFAQHPDPLTPNFYDLITNKK